MLDYDERQLLCGVLFMFSLLFLAACLPEKVEGDKHPEIPKFPEHTNNKIKIEKLQENQITSYGRTKNYVYTNHPKGMQVYDLNFEPLHLINDPKDGGVWPHMTNNESVYSVVFNRRDIKHVFEHKAPLFKKEAVPYTNMDKKIPNISFSEIRKKYKLRIEQEAKKPSYDESNLMQTLFEKEAELRKKRLNIIVDELTKDLICKKDIGNYSYILQYPDDIQAITMFFLERHSTFKKVNRCTSEYSLEYKSPESFDKTVMGNSWSGNHFVMGATAYGFNYINLKLGNEITQTKVSNSAGGDGLRIIVQTENKLILQHSAYDFYKVTKNPTH